jgi:hypothetical protein
MVRAEKRSRQGIRNETKKNNMSPKLLIEPETKKQIWKRNRKNAARYGKQIGEEATNIMTRNPTLA